MSEQHTPGPWKVVDSWDDYTIEGPNSEEIIFQDGPYGTPTIKEANARLIAAAPALLEALRDIVEYWDSIVPTDCVNEMHIKARATIAKATGVKGDTT